MKDKKEFIRVGNKLINIYDYVAFEITKPTLSNVWRVIGYYDGIEPHRHHRHPDVLVTTLTNELASAWLDKIEQLLNKNGIRREL